MSPAPLKPLRNETHREREGQRYGLYRQIHFKNIDGYQFDDDLDDEAGKPLKRDGAPRKCGRLAGRSVSSSR